MPGSEAFGKSDCTFASMEGTGGMKVSTARRTLEFWIWVATELHVTVANTPATSQQNNNAATTLTTAPATRSTSPSKMACANFATTLPSALPRALPRAAMSMMITSASSGRQLACVTSLESAGAIATPSMKPTTNPMSPKI